MKAAPTETRNETTPVTHVEPAVPAPGGHEELAPQVDHHEEEEGLDAPQVQRVDEVTRWRTRATSSGP